MNDELQATSKEQALSQLRDFIRDKHNISLDTLDSILRANNSSLKQWLDEWWDCCLGIASAFISSDAEDLVYEYKQANGMPIRIVRN